MAEETRKAKLSLKVESKGAEKAAKEIASIQKGATALQKELGKMARESQLDDLAKEFGQIAKETGETGKAVGDLTKKLKELGATDDEIKGVARSFEAARSGSGGGGGGGGGGAPAAAKFRGAASLIGGGEIVGLIDDLQDLGEGFSQLATQGGKLGGALVGTLTPAIGSTAAGVAVAGAAFLGAGVAIAALGAAIKAFTDEQAKQQAVIEGIVDAQRDVDQKINRGSTSQDLQTELDALIKDREDEAKRVADLRTQYDQNINSQGALAPLIKATSGAEEGLANSLSESEANVAKMDAQIQALQAGLTSGETKAADMKAAEEELAKQRDKEASDILKQAQLAGQAVQAQKRALGATAEANEERLTSIEDEKAAIQAQIDVLQASGNTSETVTGQIAALNAQLGNLGAESEFIKNTALDVSRARDAEKKAIKDAEDARKKAEQDAERNAERAAQAQENYNKAIKDAGRTLKEATEDINTKLGQTLADNLTGLLRDATDLASKYRQDEADLAMKAQRDERDALVDHYRSIEDITQDARKSEQEAIRDGDFKQLFLARQAAAENLRDEQKNDQREKQDRQRALTDERADLLKNAVRERADRLLNYERQNADARLNAQREMQQAQLGYSRNLALAAENQNNELKQLSKFYQDRNQIMSQANQQALQQMGAGSRVSQNGMIPTAPGNGMIPLNMISAPTTGFAAIIRKR